MQESRKIQTLLLKSAMQNSKNIFIHKQENWPEYSYADAYENICRIGTALTAAGITPDCGKRVAICLGRTPEYVFSFLACLMYGYCAVLLDDTYPEKRKEYILQSSGAEVLINAEFIKAVSVSTCERRPPLLQAEESTDAVITFTSGSTGLPKGVQHNQRGVADAVRRLIKYTELCPADIISADAPFPFVVHVFELLAPFVSGAGIVIASGEIRADAVKLADFHKCCKATAAFIPPSVLRIYKKTSDSLHLVLTGSEKVCSIVPDGYRLVSIYGQSETYPVTCFTIEKLYDVAPVGKPLEGVNAYILDESGKETAEGELCVSGNFFTGYLNDPEKTEKTLIKNPFESIDGYPYLTCTGDIVRRLKDGNILLLNRKDWMVKINGMRVEPGEIEITIREMDGICDAVVKSFEDDSHSVSLCAYYIVRSGAEIAADDIREYLRARLPYYMIPLFFVKMDAFPLNHHGKVNRLVLEKPDAASLSEEYAAPKNPVQERICNVFAKVLSLDRIGITDNFFALGGDSIKVMAAAKELDDLSVSVRTIYKYKTPEKISEGINRRESPECISEADAEQAKSQNPRIIPYQRHYIDYQLYAPKKTGALVPFYLKIPAPKYSAEEIASAIETVLRHFAVFGTVFEFGDDGELRLFYKPEYIEPVEIVKMPEAEALAWCTENVKKTVPIIGALPYRIRLFVCEDKYIFYMICQHALLDGSSQMNMLKAVIDTLEGKPLWEDTYYYYLEALEKSYTLPECRAKLEELSGVYFREDYDRLPKNDHTTDDKALIGRHYKMAVSYRELVKKAEAKDISLGCLFNAAGLLALKEYNKSDKVQLCWIYSGRYEEWIQKIIGITMTAIPVAINFNVTDSVEKLIEEIKRQESETIPYATLSPALEKNSPGLNDSLTMIYEGELKYPDNIFENAAEENLFPLRSGAPNAMECVLLPSPAEDSVTVCMNINTGLYDEDTAAKFEKLVEKNMLRILGIEDHPDN